MKPNITWQKNKLSQKKRITRMNQKPCILWFTGLSGSGKSTIASALEFKLFEMNVITYLLDGDNIRHSLNSDLGFSNRDRTENIRRIGEVSKLFVDAGLIVIVATISPFKNDRENVRKLVKHDEFIEIFVDAPLDICEKRDPKGLYKKVRSGDIENFTGIDSFYEKPLNSEVHIKTNELNVEESVEIILKFLKNRNYFDYS